MPQASAEGGRNLKIPREIINIAGFTAAIFVVVAVGSAIVGVLPDPGVWEFASAYLAPAGVAFAAYWWIAQRL